MELKSLDIEAPELSEEVKNSLMPKDCVENMVLTIGSVLRGDDAAGPLLAKKIEDSDLDSWTVVKGDLTPEDEIGYIRLVHPKNLLVVDAADMKLPVGSIRRVSKEDVAEQFFITTHSMPITFLLSELESVCDNLIFVGIQPAHTDFYGAMSEEVRRAVEDIFDKLVAGSDLAGYPALT